MLLALLLLLSPAHAQTVEFGNADPAPGSVRSLIEEMAFDMSMTATVGGQKVATFIQSSQATDERISTVRFWTDTKRELDVTYGVVQESDVAHAPEPEKTITVNPVSGRSYHVVWAKGWGLKATLPDGSKPTAAEMERLEDDFGDLGDPNAFSDYLVSRKFTVGERVDVPNELSTDLFGENNDMGVDSFTLTLKEVRDDFGADVAVFDVVMMMSGKPEAGGPPISMSIPLTGQMTAQTATGWPVLVELTGPLSVEGKATIEEGVVMELRGGGTMGLRIQSHYGSP